MTKQTIERRGDNGALESVIPTPRPPKVWLSYWATPEALAAHVASMGDGASNWHRGAWTNGAGFAGSKDMPETLAMCRAGWPEGAKRAAALRDKINATNPIGPRIVKWDVAGAVASVPRALAGNPLNMRRIDSAKLRRRPVLTLLSDTSANCNVNSKAITNRAAVVAAVVDAIEGAGFACEVITFSSSANSQLAQVVGCTVKELGAPADIGRLAFALGHTSFFRRMSWAAFTCEPFTSPLGSSLGSSNRIDEKTANERGAYVIPTAERNQHAFKDEAQAATEGLAFIIAELRKQDCPAFPKLESDAA